MDKYVCPVGLDFGTNNTVIAAILEGSRTPSFVKTETGETLHGSFVYYPENSSEKPIFGVEALSMMPNQNVIRLVKRSLGVSAVTVGDTSVFNATVVKAPKNRHVSFEIIVDGKTVVKTSKDVVTDFLVHYGDLVRNSAGSSLAWVVSKPQNWSAAQNLAFHQCLEKAKIVPEKVITEPTAAVFAYRAKASEDEKANKTLVVDMGAGTLDVVVLHDCGSGNFRSVAVGGDDFLGASNVDEIFLEVLHTEIKKEPGFNETEFAEQKSETREKMKTAKHLLSTVPQTSVNIRGVTPGTFTFKVNQEKKQDMLKPYYARAEKVIRDTFDRAAESSKKKYTAVDIMSSVEVVALVGGGMRDPHFGNSLLPSMFPTAKIVGKPNQPESINPDVAVAVGNAYWAAAITNIPTVKGLPPDPVHMQVLARSLGVETVTNYGQPTIKRWFSKIIESNTQIPTVVMRDGFTTVKENQDKVVIEIYQGEGQETTDEGVVCLGKYEIPVKTPNKMNEPAIEVEMEITEDAILIVRAGEKGEVKVELQIRDQL